ncbi:hypothetical protein NX059_010903 [Plenodomus lindquistii]|nr:hypothetical protein NX059_010903 [Plenodomus lindquistii]
MIATLSTTYQRDGIDWDFQITAEWERRIPFCSHVFLQTPEVSLQESGSLFPRFSELPSELQIQILSFCDASTLFQAMQTSPIVRAEASKLFWANQDAYFVVPASWLLEGSYPGFAWWDSSFQDCVQNVEIEFLAGDDRSICPRPDGKVEIRQNRITAFWNTLKQRFPNAKRVVINANRRIPPWWEDAEPVPLPLRVLLYACPPDIKAFTLILEEKSVTAGTGNTTLMPKTTWQRSLYQAGADSGWERIELSGIRRTVLMPPKQFQGPVGEFRGFKYKGMKTYFKRISLWPLMLQAVDQHHFGYRRDTVLACPSHGCNACFTKAGEWTIHAAEQHCMEWRKLELVPDRLRAAFQERQISLDKEDEDINRHCKDIKAAWNEKDGVRRKEIERGWTEQLDHDKEWDTGKAARKSRLWSYFSQEMSPMWEGFYEDSSESE